MSTLTKHDFFRGQRVRFVNTDKFSGEATVLKVLQKNIDVERDGGGGRVRANPHFLEPVTDEDGRSQFAPIPIPDFKAAPQPGTVVVVSEKMIARYPELSGFWVLCGTTGDKSRLFRVNNTDGRYWRIPNTEIIKVDRVRIVVEMEDES